MPKVKVNDVNLYYEIHGTGEPLLFIEGLGYSTWMWFKQVEYFSQHFKVIIFDNRGVGDSDKPDVPYSIEMMADDAVGLMKKLKIQRAHVLGISMGGIIAQELALKYPQIINKLVLGCTSFGGPNSIPMPPETIKASTPIKGISPEEQLRLAMAPAFGPGYMDANTEEIEQIIKMRMEKLTPSYAWLHQFSAAAAFNAEERISSIKSPTLILSGDQDNVLPVENSYFIHKKILNSRLEIFPGAGHLFFIEEALKFNKLVHRYLLGGVE